MDSDVTCVPVTLITFRDAVRWSEFVISNEELLTDDEAWINAFATFWNVIWFERDLDKEPGK